MRCRAVARALFGPLFEQKLIEADGRLADSQAAPGSSSKRDKAENLMMKGPREKYDAMVEELAAAGNVDRDVLFTDETKLAQCVLEVCKGYYEALPADEPRFEGQAEMMARVLLMLLFDEAHKIKGPAATSVWVPLICEGKLGGRGFREAAPMLPGLHLVFAASNPGEPFASAVHEAGLSLLTPRPVTEDANGTRIVPPLEAKVDADGTVVWDTRMLLQTLTNTSTSARARRVAAVQALMPDPDGSMVSRCAAVRLVCVADGRSAKERDEVMALTFGAAVEHQAKALLPAGLPLRVLVHPQALACSMQSLRDADPRQWQTELGSAASALVGGVAQLLERNAALTRRNGELVIRLASVTDTAEVAVGLVPRGSVVLASPGGRAGAGAAPPRRGAAAEATVPSKLLREALPMQLPGECPLAWARLHCSAEDADEVELHNIGMVLRWEAADVNNWRSKTPGLKLVWGWECPMRLVPAYVAWAEPGATELLARRCCRLSLAVLPPGVCTAEAARELRPEDACCAPTPPGGDNVLASVCMRPAIGNDVGCAAGGGNMAPFGHAHATERTSLNSGRLTSIWEVACACRNTEAATACAAVARAKYAAVYRDRRTPAKGASLAHAACVPLYVRPERLAPDTAPPTKRYHVLSLAAAHPALSAAMASAATWRAEGGAGGAGRARRVLMLEGPDGGAAPRAMLPATMSAFAGLAAAVEGAQRDDA